MRGVLYGLAAVGLLRLMWLLFGCCVIDCGEGVTCVLGFEPVGASLAVAEIALAVAFVVAAGRPEDHMGVVWSALLVLVGRGLVDFYGALALAPSLAMAHLVDMVFTLALLSGWLRAIPDTLRLAHARAQVVASRNEVPGGSPPS